MHKRLLYNKTVHRSIFNQLMWWTFKQTYFNVATGDLTHWNSKQDIEPRTIPPFPQKCNFVHLLFLMNLCMVYFGYWKSLLSGRDVALFIVPHVQTKSKRVCIFSCNFVVINASEGSVRFQILKLELKMIFLRVLKAKKFIRNEHETSFRPTKAYIYNLVKWCYVRKCLKWGNTGTYTSEWRRRDSNHGNVLWKTLLCSD
jgi:hypothetical protein